MTNKPRISADEIRKFRSKIKDCLDAVQGTGRYRGDMSNPSYGDGIAANFILNETGLSSLSAVRRWLNKSQKGE